MPLASHSRNAQQMAHAKRGRKEEELVTSSNISRRGFVKLGAFSAAAAAMAGSAAKNLVDAEPAYAAETGEVKKIRTICRACLNNCGMIAHVKDGRVIKLEGDPQDPMNKGAACAKGLTGI